MDTGCSFILFLALYTVFLMLYGWPFVGVVVVAGYTGIQGKGMCLGLPRKTKSHHFYIAESPDTYIRFIFDIDVRCYR